MLLKILLLLLTLSITTSFQNPSVPQPQLPSTSTPSSQRQGNLSPQQLLTLKSLIDNSTELYRRYRLVDMATYISQGMIKKFGDLWQVFIFGQGTEDCGFAAMTVLNGEWAVWSLYGTYDLCYVVYRTKSCFRAVGQPQKMVSQSSKITAQPSSQPPSIQQQWGPSFTDPQKQYIIALVDQSQSAGGANMTANAQYMLSKLGAGGWAVAIGGPSNGIGMATCYFRGYYAYLVDYTDLLWTYGIIREY